MKIKSIFAVGIFLTTFQSSLYATAQCICSYNTSPENSVLAGNVGVDCVHTFEGCKPTKSTFEDACNHDYEKTYGKQDWDWGDANCDKCDDADFHCGWEKKKGH